MLWQVEKGADNIHPGTVGKVGAGVRTPTVHGGPGETVLGTHVAADGSTGKNILNVFRFIFDTRAFGIECEVF